MKKSILLGIIIMFSASFLTDCKKSKGEPPVLPPYGSMIIDFSNFTSQKKSAPVAPFIKGTESSTWEFAAAVSGVWNSLISTNLEVPVSSFQNTVENNPAFVSENLWQWSYDFTITGVTYKARLTGQITTTLNLWKMYITLEGTGGYSDFLWVEGTSLPDASAGQWIFNESPLAPLPMFQTDWTKSGDLITSVKYTYIKNDTYKDSYITSAGISGTYDSSFNIHFANGLYSDSDIEWDSSTRNGRLKSVDYLQDENWHCWDSNKINTICQ